MRLKTSHTHNLNIGNDTTLKIYPLECPPAGQIGAATPSAASPFGHSPATLRSDLFCSHIETGVNLLSIGCNKDPYT